MSDNERSSPVEDEKSILDQSGYTLTSKISDTMQGRMWRALNKRTNENVVIKVTSIELHSKSIGIVNGKEYKVNENIMNETSILKYLTKDKKSIKSIVKYMDSFKRYVDGQIHSNLILYFVCYTYLTLIK